MLLVWLLCAATAPLIRPSGTFSPAHSRGRRTCSSVRPGQRAQSAPDRELSPPRSFAGEKDVCVCMRPRGPRYDVHLDRISCLRVWGRHAYTSRASRLAPCASKTKCGSSGRIRRSMANRTAAVEPGMVSRTVSWITPPVARLSMAAAPILRS